MKPVANDRSTASIFASDALSSLIYISVAFSLITILNISNISNVTWFAFSCFSFVKLDRTVLFTEGLLVLTDVSKTLESRLSKRQSSSTTTFLLRTSQTWTIYIYKHVTIFPDSNHSLTCLQFVAFVENVLTSEINQKLIAWKKLWPADNLKKYSMK